MTHAPTRPSTLSARRSAMACLAVFCLLAAHAPASRAEGPDLAASYDSLSVSIKAGAMSLRDGSDGSVMPTPSRKARSAKDKFKEIANAFKSMDAMPTPAEMVGGKGVWNLEMAASPSAVLFSSNGFVRKMGDGSAVKAHIRFTQEITRSDNPYANGAPVFRVKEAGIHLAKQKYLRGDPPEVVLDLQKSAEFKTVYAPGWGLSVAKEYSCRANDSDRILCKVKLAEGGLLKTRRTYYLGFRHDRP